MKNMNLPLLRLAALMLLLMASCTPDEDDVPGSDSRDPFTGSWTTNESSKHFGSSAYTLAISKSTSDETSVIIKNFYNLGSSANTIGTVSGSTISIVNQQVSGQTINGSGTLSGSKINWNYVTDDGIQKDTCTAVSQK